MGRDTILSPGYAQLLQERDQLRIKVEELIIERDRLLMHECPRVETLYNAKIGTLVYEAFVAETNLLLLRRKVELIQAHLNQSKIPDVEFIEQQITLEAADYKNKLASMEEALRNCIPFPTGKNQGIPLTPKEREELKALYRAAVKKLHQDLNPFIPEGHKKLYYAAVLAFKKEDLDTLRTVMALTGNTILPDEEEESSALALAREIEKLKDMEANIKSYIEKMYDNFPLNQIKILQDEAQVAKIQKDLIESTRANTEALAKYQSRLEPLLASIEANSDVQCH
jgi:hypothetical protein